MPCKTRLFEHHLVFRAKKEVDCGYKLVYVLRRHGREKAVQGRWSLSGRVR